MEDLLGTIEITKPDIKLEFQRHEQTKTKEVLLYTKNLLVGFAIAHQIQESIPQIYMTNCGSRW